MPQLNNVLGMGQIVLPFFSVLLLLLVGRGGFAKFVTVVTLFASISYLDFFNLTLESVLQGLVLVLALNTVLMTKASDYVADHKADYYILILLATLGAELMLSASDFVTLFVALELMSFSLYGLAGAKQRDKKAAESSIKYFLLGSFSSAILLYGIAWLYGATHSLQFSAVALPGGVMTTFALLLFVSGFLFKLALVPFHAWATDVYEGAPTPVSSYMATVVKVAALLVILKIFSYYDNTVLSVCFAALGCASLVLANLAALRQRNIKRLLAYSAISHAGFLVLGCLGADFKVPVIYYLFVYVLNTASAFSIAYNYRGEGEDAYDIESYYGLVKKHPIAATVLAANMLSLAGIPPFLGGVFAKFYLLNSLVKANQIVLVVVGIAAALVACIYYLRVVSALFLKENETEQATKPSITALVTATILTLLGIALGVVPDMFFGFIATL